MIPSASTFVRGVEFYLCRRRVAVRLDVAMIAEAIAHAERLAAGIERDEPAALFFACAERSRAFFPEASNIVPHVARAHAGAIGLELRAADVTLDIHQTRILRKEMPFTDLRDWFAAHLVPIEKASR